MNDTDVQAEPAPNGRSLTSFFASRWRREVPLGRVLWQDMLIYGTLINVATTLLASLLFVRDAPTALAATVHFVPLPYNFFLFLIVWRLTVDAAEPVASAARMTGLVWLVAATII